MKEIQLKIKKDEFSKNLTELKTFVGKLKEDNYICLHVKDKELVMSAVGVDSLMEKTTPCTTKKGSGKIYLDGPALESKIKKAKCEELDITFIAEERKCIVKIGNTKLKVNAVCDEDFDENGEVIKKGKVNFPKIQVKKRLEQKNNIECECEFTIKGDAFKSVLQNMTINPYTISDDEKYVKFELEEALEVTASANGAVTYMVIMPESVENIQEKVEFLIALEDLESIAKKNNSNVTISLGKTRICIKDENTLIQIKRPRDLKIKSATSLFKKPTQWIGAIKDKEEIKSSLDLMQLVKKSSIDDKFAIKGDESHNSQLRFMVVNDLDETTCTDILVYGTKCKNEINECFIGLSYSRIKEAIGMMEKNFFMKLSGVKEGKNGRNPGFLSFLSKTSEYTIMQGLSCSVYTDK